MFLQILIESLSFICILWTKVSSFLLGIFSFLLLLLQRKKKKKSMCKNYFFFSPDVTRTNTCPSSSSGELQHTCSSGQHQEPCQFCSAFCLKPPQVPHAAGMLRGLEVPGYFTSMHTEVRVLQSCTGGRTLLSSLSPTVSFLFVLYTSFPLLQVRFSLNLNAVMYGVKEYHMYMFLKTATQFMTLLQNVKEQVSLAN